MTLEFNRYLMILKELSLYGETESEIQEIGTIEKVIHKDKEPWLIEICLIDKEKKNFLKTIIEHKRFLLSSKIYEKNDNFIGSISRSKRIKIGPYGSILTIITFFLLLAILPLFIPLESYKTVLPYIMVGFIIVILIFILYYHVGMKKYYLLNKNSQTLFEVVKKFRKSFIVYNSNNSEVVAEIIETGYIIPKLKYEIEIFIEDQNNKLLILGFLLYRYFEKLMNVKGFGNY
ncbi:MAG: hypothetical protein HWN67_21130 [Candidatus Helarchaeota archaeon]|nr:hypothetical protein [Candidatus Helarchaeota archaeon]